jgi:hypothetical protein
MVALLLAPGMALGQDVDASAAIYAEPMASIEASGPAELWSPVELADIPFWYTCGRAFHAVDLEEAPTGLEVDPPIPTTRPIVFNDGTDAMAVSVRDPGRSPQEGALWYREYERTEDGWVGGSGSGTCEPWARFPTVGGLGGYWRLDPRRSAPNARSRRIHLKVWYGRECPSAVRIMGRPRVHLTDEAALIAVPVTVRHNTDVCIGGRAERVTARLPEPLGDRQLYDAGTLPIRAVGEVMSEPSPRLASGSGTWGPLAVIDDPGSGALDAAGGSGRLRIGHRCVFLRADNGERTTLVWRSGQTRWDRERRQIILDDQDLGKIRLSLGDRIGLGGASTGEGPPIAAWLSARDDSCPTPSWTVHQVFVEGR